ncbi:MAG: sodium:alanine symporter family protein [Clostridia bacterium]|nr:sodium:alanine symporter family protein [Clostridia bacterium]
MSFIPLLLTVVGAYFLIRLRAFFLCHPLRTLRLTFRALRKEDGRSLVAFALALAGTLGVGNLSGVALGLLVGGAGSLFWIWVSSVFACVLKYAEVLIAKDVSSYEGNGMMQVIRRFVPGGRAVSGVYALVCLLLACTMGAMLQSRAVTECATSAIGVSSPVVSLVVTALLLFVIVGGASRIERAVSVTVPVAALCYIVLSVGVLCVGYRYIPSALAAVWNGAFSTRGVLGGVIGTLTSEAVRRGFAGGLLSNEAGAGTSALAHVRSSGTSPSAQGLIGMCEVVCDTAICTLTGLSLLVGTRGSLPSASSVEPIEWLSDVFAGSLGGWCRGVLLLSVFAFAFSTIVCWYYYGRRCALYLWQGMPSWLYALLYLASAFLGGIVTSRLTVRVVDLSLGVLCVLSLGALLAAERRICTLHRAQFLPLRDTRV